MKKYKTKEKKIYAYDDDTNEKFLNDRIEKLGLVEITDEEIAEMNNQKDLENHTAERIELYNLQKYLNDTDYISTKCYERGLSVEVEYPKDYVKRQEARDRIDTIRAILQI